MRKVTTINLNGRAYQLEDQGYEKLQTYLHRAETALANDPDKTEVLADIEQAIADKCDRVLKAGKNVVTTQQITTILTEMGEVESDGSTSKDDHEHTDGPSGTKRLFVIREGAMFLGVCRGLGAYFGVDPTIIRIAFVLLTIFTSGIWIVIYLLLGLFLPKVKNENDLAEAYGAPMTAQAIAERARERATDPEMLQNVSAMLMKILRIIARIARVVFAIIFGILTAAWLVTLWQLIFGRLQFYDQLQILNGWRVFLGITAAYLIVALPILVVSRLSDRFAENRGQSRVSNATEGSLSALWGISWVVLVILGVSYAQNFREYANTHQGWIDIGGSHLCADAALCNPDGQLRHYRYQD